MTYLEHLFSEIKIGNITAANRLMMPAMSINFGVDEKGLSGSIDTIRPCLGCCLGCIDRVFDLEQGSCVVNPRVGREYLVNKTKKADL